MHVLVDSSVWIDYFRSGANSSSLDFLIDENLIVINDIILAELVPFLIMNKQMKVVRLLQAIYKLPLTINWQEIINFQVTCLQKGINGIAIPDLIIAQNAIHNHCQIYSLDKHFRLLAQAVPITLLETEP